MTRTELISLWEARRELFQRLRARVEGARIIEEFIADITSVDDDERNTLVGLQQAAVHSGYSVEHLGRLVRQGRLTNHGRKGSPRLRIGDLPARKVDVRRASSYNVDTDARMLRNGRQ